MTITLLSTPVKEEGVAVFTVSWLDEDSAAVTPDSATWTLVDQSGNVINSRSAVTINSLSTSNAIVLEDDDLAIIQPQDSQRELSVTFTYTSATYGELTQKDGVRFNIDDLWGVT